MSRYNRYHSLSALHEFPWRLVCGLRFEFEWLWVLVPLINT